jgi:hypothetical protein
LAEGDAACRGLNLNDYLIKVRPSEFSSVMMVMLTGGGRIVMLAQPVQRICKYPLFLRVRYTTTTTTTCSPRLPP